MYSILGRFALDPARAQMFAIGITAYTMVFILMGGITQSYAYEREGRTLAFVYVSQVNRHVNFLSRAILHYPNALLSFITTVITAWLVVGLDFSSVNWAGFVIAVLITAVSITAFAQFAGIFAIVFREWFNTNALANGILFALTGVIIPISIFPTFVQELAKLLPMTNGLSVIRATFFGAPFSEVSGSILREALTGIAYYTIASFGFILFERVVKRTGALNLE
jgi:ABC-type polysaccharide/polyol phosphate export permease